VRKGLPPLLLTAAVLATGCGGSGHSSQSGTPVVRILPEVPRVIPTPPPTHKAASAQAVAVIRNWSNALRAGQVTAAARYFQLPSELINGVGPGGTLAVIGIHSLRQAEAANETLPCGAQFISADQRGRYVNALFRLTGRPGPGGSACGSGTSATARTNFVIAGGRIVEWIRAPDDPGDNGTPGNGPPGGGRGGGSNSNGATPVV
jgi:hypothetical protein